jgi:hypothetical protein
LETNPKSELEHATRREGVADDPMPCSIRRSGYRFKASAGTASGLP